MYKLNKDKIDYWASVANIANVGFNEPPLERPSNVSLVNYVDY